ncbi:MAG: amidohydrolase family protein [Nitrospiraceae bacterium]|nr:amidohydrolase family protein [Nitrospiraceae bacterium]
MAYAIGTKHYVIDIHVHGAEKYDTRTRRQDDILQIAQIHGQHGTSALLPTIYPGSVEIMREHLGAIRRAMAAQREGATILGAHLEGPFLNPERAGSLDGKSFADPSPEAFNRLVEDFEDIIKIVTIAPELPGALRVIELCREKGFLVQMGHSDASIEQAEEGKHAGATGITHLFNAMRGFHHREPGLAGFGLMDEDIYVEIIADLAHLHPQSLKMIFDMKSPDKIILISDSVMGPGWGSGAIRGAGGTLLGSGITLADSIKNLVSLGVPPDRALQFASDNPMTYLGMTAVQ